MVSRAAGDGDVVERRRGSLVVDDAAASLGSCLVLTGVIGDGTASHGECAVIADAATTVVCYVAGDGDFRQIGRATFDDQSAAVTAPAAFQRAVAKVERGTFAYRDDLTAAFAALRQLAVQRVAAKVDGYRLATFDAQCTVTKVDVRSNFDVRTVGGDGLAQFLIRRDVGLCPACRCSA